MISNSTLKLFTIKTPLTADKEIFLAVWNQGIDARLEAFTRSTHEVKARKPFGEEWVFHFHPDEVCTLIRRLRELGTERAESWADDIERYAPRKVQPRRRTPATTLPYFDRYDIVDAYYVIECDYNLNGWLHERPSNRRRSESSDVQLHRIGVEASPSACEEGVDGLSTNGQAIYALLVKRYGFPPSASGETHLGN